MNKKLVGGIIGVALVAVGIAASLIVPSKLSEHYYTQAVEQDSLHNYVEALSLYKKAADRNPEASYRISEIYSRLLPDSLQDSKAAFEYLLKSYEDGRLESANLIAYFYKEGIGVKKDSLKTIEYLEKPSGKAEAECKYNHSQIIFGKDTLKAVSLLKEASDLHYPMALYTYGTLHFTDEVIPKDLGKGEKLLIEAADSGNVNAQSMLAGMYVYGDYLKKDSEKGFKYATMAAKQGDAECMCLLGYCYGTGQGVVKDDNKAFFWFNKSAELDHPRGVYNKGVCVLNGIGTIQNSEEGIKLFVKAADMGEEHAVEFLKAANRPVTRPAARRVSHSTNTSYTSLNQYRCNVCQDTYFIHYYDSEGVRHSSPCPSCIR